MPDTLHAKSTDLKIYLECQRFKANQNWGKPRKGYPGSFWNYTDGPGQRFNSRFSTAVPNQNGIFSQGTNWTGKLRDLPRERLNKATVPWNTVSQEMLSPVGLPRRRQKENNPRRKSQASRQTRLLPMTLKPGRGAPETPGLPEPSPAESNTVPLLYPTAMPRRMQAPGEASWGQPLKELTMLTVPREGSSSKGQSTP